MGESVRPSDVELLLSDADKRHMVLSMEAAAAGDAALALEHELAVSVLPGGPSAALLHEMVLLGDEAPKWVWSRWILHQAYRWLLVCQDDAVDQAVRTTVAALHGPAMARLEGPEELYDLGTIVAASDWVAAQLAVHELGGLRRFVETKASDELRERADFIDAWVTAPMGGYRLDRTCGTTLKVTDLANGDVLDVLNIGALSERSDGEYVVGRVAPISVAPLRMFEERPLSVDLATAHQVADETRTSDALSWVHVLADACDDGRVGEGFSMSQGTLLSSDLLLNWAPFRLGDPVPGESVPRADRPESQAPRFLELKAAGLSATAANGVMVCEFGIMLRDLSRGGLDRFGTHLSAVLLEPDVVAAVRQLLCEPAHRKFWEDMAGRVTEPFRSRCLDFVERCA